jgi:hypothetical protein
VPDGVPTKEIMIMTNQRNTTERRVYASRSKSELLVSVWVSRLQGLGHPMDGQNLRDLALRLCRLGVETLEAIETLESALEIGEARR